MRIALRCVLQTAPNNIRGGARRSTKRRSRRRGNGGDSVGKYFGDAWSLAKRTASGLNEIRKLINVEQKFKENSGTLNMDYNGTVTYLSGLSQGDNIIEREGNSIKLQKFQLQYQVEHTGGSPVPCRVMVVRDLQNQGATFTLGTVLETVGSTIAPYSFMNFVNSVQQNKRFTVVYDELITVSTYEPSQIDSFTTTHDCHVYYRGTDATVSSAGNGSYFLITLSGNVTTNLPIIEYNTRFEFTDN